MYIVVGNLSFTPSSLMALYVHFLHVVQTATKTRQIRMLDLIRSLAVSQQSIAPPSYRTVIAAFITHLRAPIAIPALMKSSKNRRILLLTAIF